MLNMELRALTLTKEVEEVCLEDIQRVSGYRVDCKETDGRIVQLSNEVCMIPSCHIKT